jgi:hypothetical protein
MRGEGPQRQKLSQTGAVEVLRSAQDDNDLEFGQDKFYSNKFRPKKFCPNKFYSNGLCSNYLHVRSPVDVSQYDIDGSDAGDHVGNQLPLNQLG